MASGDWLDWLSDAITEHPVGFIATLWGICIGGALLNEMSEGRNQENLSISQINEDLKKEKEEKERRLNEQRKKLKTADEYLTEAEQIVSDLLGQPRLNQVAEDYPAELERLRADIGAWENSANGADMTAAMLLYQRAVDLQKDYQDFDHRWKTAKKQWELRHQRLEEKFAGCRTLRIPQESVDGADDLELDCDEWCSDALEWASRELEPLEQPEDSTIRDFNRLCEQAEELSERIDQIVIRALGNFHSSEQRLMTSEIVVDALSRRLWRAADYRFSTDGDDNERLNDLILLLKNPVGDRLKFVFRRGEQQTTTEGVRVEDQMEVTMELKGVYSREFQHTLFGTIVQALREHNVDLSYARQSVKGVTI